MKKKDRSWERSRLDLPENVSGLRGVLHFGRYDHSATSSRGLLPHSHEGAMEICFLAKGRQTYAVNGEIYNLSGGDIYVTYPNESHDTAGEPEEKSILYWIIIAVDPLPTKLLNWRGKEAEDLARELQRLPARHFPAPPDSHRRLSRIIDVIRNDGSDLKCHRASTIFSEWLLEVIDASHRRARPQPSATIMKSISHIEKHLDQWQSMPELANACGLSASRFKERFKLETGIPPGEFMLRKKIEAAKAALLKTDLSITEIAFDLGFSTSQYFSTVFRRFTATTPKKFRTDNKKG